MKTASRLQRATASPPLWDGHPGDFGLTKEPKGETGKEEKRARCLAALSSASGRFTGLRNDRRTKTTSIHGSLPHRKTSGGEVELHAKRAPSVALARRRPCLHSYFMPVYKISGIRTGCLDAGPARVQHFRTLPRRCKRTHPARAAREVTPDAGKRKSLRPGGELHPRAGWENVNNEDFIREQTEKQLRII